MTSILVVLGPVTITMLRSLGMLCIITNLSNLCHSVGSDVLIFTVSGTLMPNYNTVFASHAEIDGDIAHATKSQWEVG